MEIGGDHGVKTQTPSNARVSPSLSSSTYSHRSNDQTSAQPIGHADDLEIAVKSPLLHSAIMTFFTVPKIFTLAISLRLILLAWGRYQDTHSPLKYTDIDYLVFTDAARYISRSRSPYERDTYRYTPLLAWLLYPTAWGGWWFDFGKVVFAAGDVVTGALIYWILRGRGSGERGKAQRGGGAAMMDEATALKYASIWLLNPMVANISTRGSSEGLLAVIVVALLWAVLRGYVKLAGCLLGLGVHFKIYPFIYAATVVWWLDEEDPKGKGRTAKSNETLLEQCLAFINWKRFTLAWCSLSTFMVLNMIMYRMWVLNPFTALTRAKVSYRYGPAFIEHSYTYHLTRIDHRHNFSVYNTLLHLRSATTSASGVQVESLAFLPQLSLAVVAMPLLLGKKDIAGTMLAQTFAFVTFNKVCTSQYFLWYMVFLPFYLPRSSFIRKPKLGIAALIAWVMGQAVWLQQGFQLEFLGKSTFVPGLWLATILFFGVNCWILGIIVGDIQANKIGFIDATSKARKIQ